MRLCSSASVNVSNPLFFGRLLMAGGAQGSFFTLMQMFLALFFEGFEDCKVLSPVIEHSIGEVAARLDEEEIRREALKNWLHIQWNDFSSADQQKLFYTLVLYRNQLQAMYLFLKNKTENTKNTYSEFMDFYLCVMEQITRQNRAHLAIFERLHTVIEIPALFLGDNVDLFWGGGIDPCKFYTTRELCADVDCERAKSTVVEVLNGPTVALETTITAEGAPQVPESPQRPSAAKPPKKNHCFLMQAPKMPRLFFQEPAANYKQKAARFGHKVVGFLRSVDKEKMFLVFSGIGLLLALLIALDVISLGLAAPLTFLVALAIVGSLIGTGMTVMDGCSQEPCSRCRFSESRQLPTQRAVAFSELSELVAVAPPSKGLFLKKASCLPSVTTPLARLVARSTRRARAR